jgi:putative effector of murein hydrolase LrgA (UPF0299 family)
MRVFRTVIAAGMIVLGSYIIAQMVHYPLRSSLTGIVLGGAMIALGVVRLRMLYGRTRRA